MRTAPAHRGLPAWDEGLAAPAIPDHLAIHDNALADAVLDVRQPFGPGRGTLAADALRAMRGAGCVPTSIEFVETSPVLRDKQLEAVPGATLCPVFS